jgi:23S rRNA (uracil1939-C5)-methyltransferase
VALETGTTLVAGQELIVTASEMVAGGDALARVDGLPLFIRGLYPGDQARVGIIEAKKGFARAEVLEVVRESPERRLVPCPIADECGGCNWTALRLDRQLAAKEKILRESLRRIGKIDAALLPAIRLHASALNYRARSRLHIDRETRAVGFFALKSNRVVPIVAECEVIGPQAVRNLDAVRRLAREDPHAREVHLWETDGELVIRSDKTEHVPIDITVRKQRFALSTGAFFQVNRHILGTMFDLLVQCASRNELRRRALDLYAGVGFFTLPLSDLFHRVVGVEGSRESHAHALRNASGLRNIEMIGMPVEQYVRRMKQSDLVFLDPPRAGADPTVIEAVAEKAVERICYLSCDPVTFSRDAGRLTARGWRLASLDLLDLFPNTHHVETFSSFERAS